MMFNKTWKRNIQTRFRIHKYTYAKLNNIWIKSDAPPNISHFLDVLIENLIVVFRTKTHKFPVRTYRMKNKSYLRLLIKKMLYLFEYILIIS